MITLHHGDARDVLAMLPEKSVQTCITSPPYFGLRAYGTDPREIGRETTPAAYVAALVAVFAEVWRVLRDDGVCWINLGDSYAGGNRAGWRAGNPDKNGGNSNRDGVGAVPGILEKNLMGMPWRVAFALQDDGWILRSDIIWSKPNPMPESVTDRPTRAHEYVFLFAKRQRYFYDATAIADAATNGERFHGAYDKPGIMKRTADRNGRDDEQNQTATRNRRSVWTIATQPYSGAHFATMPEALIEPCVLAGSAAQACETCGAAWGRVTEQTHADDGLTWQERKAKGEGPRRGTNNRERGTRTGGNTFASSISRDLGFAPRCDCATNTGAARSIVLDPFGGSGTVARVAERFQRDSILIDLNAAYLELQEQRTDGVQVEFTL